MNSAQIQSKHREIYEEFFSDHYFVISMPFIMSWIPDQVSDKNGVDIRQKIPYRLFLGVKPGGTATNNMVTFDRINYINPSDGNFVNKSLIDEAPRMQKIHSFINEQRNHPENIKINILSELPRSVGLGFEGIFCGLMATLLQRYNQKFTQSKQLHYKSIPLIEQLNNTGSPLNAICKRSFEMLKIIRPTQKQCTGLLCSLTEGTGIKISFAEDESHFCSGGNYTDLQYFCFDVDELLDGGKTIDQLPLDVTLIYSGRPFLVEQVDTLLCRDKAHTTPVSDFLRCKFGDLVSNTLPIKKPKFIKDFLSDNDDEDGSSMTDYNKMLGYMSLDVLNSIINGLKKGYIDNAINEIILALNHFKSAVEISRKTSTYLDELLQEFAISLKNKSDIIALSYNDINVMGGTISCIAPLESHRTSIQKTLEKINYQFPGTSIIYENRKDGLESNGLLFEQDLEDGKVSDYFVGKNTILEDINGNTAFVDYDEIVSDGKFDIILDTINMKIFLRGQKLTSKDLHSQSATVELISRLVKNINQEIPNKNLPISTYSKNKNDMTGKVVLPIVKLVNEKLGKQLNLTCRGGLYDYVVKLGSSQVSIGIIKKVKFEQLEE